MKKRGKLYLVLILAGILLILAAVGFFGKSSEKNDKQEEEQEEVVTLDFPYELADGKLEITSLFQSDVPNPDNNFEEGTDLASIELLNKSGEYLESAEVILVMVEGTELKFTIQDLPAGEKVWAFDLNNTSIEAESGCLSAECETVFSETSSDWTTGFQAETDGSSVMITNLTTEEQTDLPVTCHCLMEETFIGVTAYEYSIESLQLGETTNLDVIECYFGDAKVVCIEP